MKSKSLVSKTLSRPVSHSLLITGVDNFSGNDPFNCFHPVHPPTSTGTLLWISKSCGNPKTQTGYWQNGMMQHTWNTAYRCRQKALQQSNKHAALNHWDEYRKKLFRNILTWMFECIYRWIQALESHVLRFIFFTDKTEKSVDHSSLTWR